MDEPETVISSYVDFSAWLLCGRTVVELAADASWDIARVTLRASQEFAVVDAFPRQGLDWRCHEGVDAIEAGRVSGRYRAGGAPTAAVRWLTPGRGWTTLLLHVPGFPRENWYPGDGWAEALQPGVRVCPPSRPGRPLSVILTPERFETQAPSATVCPARPDGP
jgi:hypothetical protein